MKAPRDPRGCWLPQGLVTLLILPISNAANASLQPDRYWILNVSQVPLPW